MAALESGGERRIHPIPSPSGNDLYLGPLFVHAYGLMYMLGVAAAVWLTIRRWGRRGRIASSSITSPPGHSPRDSWADACITWPPAGTRSRLTGGDQFAIWKGGLGI